MRKIIKICAIFAFVCSFSLCLSLNTIQAEQQEVESIEEKETPKANLSKQGAYIGSLCGGALLVVGTAFFIKNNKHSLTNHK